jgi:cyclase
MVLKSNKCYNTINFELGQYLGDPISIARLFSDLGADELFIFDKSFDNPIYQNNRLRNICQEVYIPIAYGGGVYDINEVDLVMSQGVEKIVIKIDGKERLEFIETISRKYGKQSVVGCINFYSENRSKSYVADPTNKSVLEDLYTKGVNAGAGELLIQDIARSGTRLGFFLDAVETVLKESKIPIIYAGGASNVDSLLEPLELGASGVGASTIFSLSNLGNSPLISYISTGERLLVDRATTQ